jgi:hypothetical protein
MEVYRLPKPNVTAVSELRVVSICDCLLKPTGIALEPAVIYTELD